PQATLPSGSNRPYSVLQPTLSERRNAPEGRLWLPEPTPRIGEDREALAMLVLTKALPRLSAIVSKMLPHDALHMACFDQRGHRVVNASTADAPDITTSDGEDVI